MRGPGYRASMDGWRIAVEKHECIWKPLGPCSLGVVSVGVDHNAESGLIVTCGSEIGLHLANQCNQPVAGDRIGGLLATETEKYPIRSCCHRDGVAYQLAHADAQRCTFDETESEILWFRQ